MYLHQIRMGQTFHDLNFLLNIPDFMCIMASYYFDGLVCFGGNMIYFPYLAEVPPSQLLPKAVVTLKSSISKAT